MVLMLRQTSVSSAVRAGSSSDRRASTVSGRSFEAMKIEKQVEGRITRTRDPG
jgi:hypothetical protein